MSEGKKLGVKTETVSTTQIPFNVTSQNPFNKCMLVSVEAKATEIKKGDKAGQKPVTLSFTFESGDRTKRHTETIWPLADDDAKFNDKFGWMEQRIKHVAEKYIDITPEIANQLSGDNFDEFFTNVANVFNTGKAGKPIFKTEDDKPIAMWLKLTYDNNNRLQFPFPNFLEKVSETNKEAPKTLTVGNKDKVDKVVASNNAPGVNTKGNTEDLPDGFDF
ncbi:MAG: hypothetical protein JST04_00850 [Bdellovibrionales bacterium]|nr:hypothetical protein [Bdellovibrionales bacterium]